MSKSSILCGTFVCVCALFSMSLKTLQRGNLIDGECVDSFIVVVVMLCP